MVKKKVLITGASGYIGSRLCQYLADLDYNVTALCHSKIPSDTAWKDKMEEIIIGDLRNNEFLNKLAFKQFQIVIHLVSLDHHQSNNGIPSDVSAVNITPVWSLLDVLAKNNLEKFIYFSTTQVYDLFSGGCISESNVACTQSPYGLTHHIGEIICDYYNRNSTVQCSVVRLSNSYGAPVFSENNCWWLVVNDLCRMAFLKKEIVLQSDGSPLRDFIHGWDVCQAVEVIIKTEAKHNIYNLSSGKTISIMDIALDIQKIYLKRYGSQLPLTSKPLCSDDNKIDYVVDNKLIVSLGFELKWSLERGINDLFDYLEKENITILR